MDTTIDQFPLPPGIIEKKNSAQSTQQDSDEVTAKEKSFRTNAELNKSSYSYQPRTVAERLRELTSSKVPYVFVMDYESWPDSSRRTPVIMTTNVESIVSILGLIHISGNLFKISGYESFRCYVYPKGANVFPETFETKMMGSSEVLNGIRVPSEWFRFHALLYWNMARDGMLCNDPERRRVYGEYVSKAVGMFVAPDQLMCSNLSCFHF